MVACWTCDYWSRVRSPVGPFSRNTGQLSLASLQLLNRVSCHAGVKARMSTLVGVIQYNVISHRSEAICKRVE